MTRPWPAVLSALALLGTTAEGAGAGRPPNVVLIVSDDHAWTDYSFMGHPHIRTPHIDRLAASGLTFRRGYVPSSLCSPSLATILTGLYAHQHKLTSNDPPLPLPRAEAGRAPGRDPSFQAQRREMIRFIEGAPTLPRLLAGAGYTSFQAGKWWGGITGSAGSPRG